MAVFQTHHIGRVNPNGHYLKVIINHNDSIVVSLFIPFKYEVYRLNFVVYSYIM